MVLYDHEGEHAVTATLADPAGSRGRPERCHMEYVTGQHSGRSAAVLPAAHALDLERAHYLVG
jgi:hypothetical protein